jgi:iron complex outermembrane receptor protein
LGVKTNFFGRKLLLNVDVFTTTVHDFQANVVDTGPGALRGYLANIEKVRVKGAEIDSAFLMASHLSGHVAAAYTDGKYVSYRNGPCPIELIGNATTVCDLSGKRLSSTPRWAGSVGAEYVLPLSVAGIDGDAYLDSEVATRSWIYGDASDSQYTAIDGYTLVNARLGFRTSKGWDVALWARNLFDRNYLQNVTVQAGNSGLIAGTPGEQRLVGLMVRATF